MKFTNMINAVDAHACGEHGRVIVGGVINVPGKTSLTIRTCNGYKRRVI